jgi:hypothetical protein
VSSSMSSFGSFQTRAANVVNPITLGTTAAASCSPVTEIYDGSTDWIFMSVSAAGTQTGCSGACLYNYNVTTNPGSMTTGISTAASSSGLGGSTSGIIIDNTSGDAGASQIYYSPLGNLSSCTGSVSATCAVQTSQANP